MIKKKENNKLKNILKKLESIYKNGKTIIIFGDTEIEKHKFIQHKRPISMKNIEINKIAVTDNVSFGNNDFFIYFTGHKDT